MSLVKREKFAPSQTPYAVEPTSITQDDREIVNIQAVWAGRKRGRTTVSVGHLWGFCVPTDPAEFLAQFDTRYGGRPRARWDGETLWTVADVTEDERAELLRRCEQVLAGFPDPPSGFDGWYYAGRTDR